MGENGIATPTATTPSSAEVDLTWIASTDDVAVGGYLVFRDGAQIASTSSTSFADTTVLAGSTHTYYVQAFDTSGNRSAPSGTVSVTTPGGSPALTFSPTDDAYVWAASPSVNFGSATSIQVDNSPVKHFLLKFSVQGVGTGQVVSAKLRLYCVDPSNLGGLFHAVTSNTWTEGTVTWNTAPAFAASTTASLGSVSTGTWYEVDVTSLVQGDGPLSIGVTSTSTNGADYASKEAGASLAPQLVVTTA